MSSAYSFLYSVYREGLEKGGFLVLRTKEKKRFGRKVFFSSPCVSVSVKCPRRTQATRTGEIKGSLLFERILFFSHIPIHIHQLDKPWKTTNSHKSALGKNDVYFTRLYAQGTAVQATETLQPHWGVFAIPSNCSYVFCRLLPQLTSYSFSPLPPTIAAWPSSELSLEGPHQAAWEVSL